MHAATDGPAMVRDFTKWDDTPGSLRHFGESAVRAYKFSMTPPYGPTLLAVDTLMQEDEIPGGAKAAPTIPKLPRAAPPRAKAGAVREAAKLLVNAERPLIYADRAARTPEGLRLLVELAEVLQAPVCDSSNRLNFPWRHPLNQSRRLRTLIGEADVVLALEPGDPFGLFIRTGPRWQCAIGAEAGRDEDQHLLGRAVSQGQLSGSAALRGLKWIWRWRRMPRPPCRC